jgi:hypothetical protein
MTRARRVAALFVAALAAPAAAIAAPQSAGCFFQLGLAYNNAPGVPQRAAGSRVASRLDAAALGETPRLAGVSILNPALQPTDDAQQVRLSSLELPDGRRLAVMFDLVCGDAFDTLAPEDGPLAPGEAFTISPTRGSAVDSTAHPMTLAAFNGAGVRASSAMLDMAPSARSDAGDPGDPMVRPDVDTMVTGPADVFAPAVVGDFGYTGASAVFSGLGNTSGSMLPPPNLGGRDGRAELPPAVPGVPALSPSDPVPPAAGLAAPVPEPSGWSMLVLSLGGLGAFLRHARGRTLAA